MVVFSNPRLRAEIQDYPLGGSKRGLCVFEAKSNLKTGWRVGRTTTGATKWDTYARLVAIVDGDDGRTYILKATNYGFISIAGSDFRDPAKNVLGDDRTSGFGSCFQDGARFEELMALIQQAHAAAAAVTL